MESSLTQNYTEQLRELMRLQGISSFQKLIQISGVSKHQIQTLRQGKIAKMRLEILVKLAQALNLSITQLLVMFSDSSIAAALSQQEESASVAAVKQEYQYLQQQFNQQRDVLQQEFQQAAIASIESWMLQWPNAINAVKNNPQLPAERLLPLVYPIEQLLQDWSIESIGTVGEQISYNPQYHQIIAGNPKPGDLVKVRRVGYQQQGKLLYRAKVEAI